MDLGLIFSVAQTLFSSLHSSELKEICSLCGYKSLLDDLQSTVSTVRAVLRDAENKQELSSEAQLWIEELKNVVYDADDLFDEFTTLAEQKQLIKGGKVSEKLHYFFSCRNPLGIAYNMSRGVKKIRKKLDAIANNHSQFGFGVDSQSIRRKREETCSYVYEGNIIGREDDVENIASFLLDGNIQHDVSFLTIVGIGGLGKTALAQLVYNDARVKSAFPLRLWACVSDHELQQLDVKVILCKILASATGQMHEGYTMEWLQHQLREKLTRSKYLLVLDDIWTENPHRWHELVKFLLGGQRRSWIVVTTRSKETAKIVGGGPMYELQGLSKENSWRLFQKMAFGLEQSEHHDDLVRIGQEIIKGCARNPLAIRVTGSLLNGQDKSKWLSFQEIGLCNFEERRNDIMSILMFSYQQLEFPLKSCFAYCALFPKDFEIKKDLLIDLWMANSYIVPLNEGQRIEDAAEEYISILLQRCFFQNVEHNEYGEIFSFKMHDLMHDLAIKVAGKEICVTNSVTNVVDKKVRHLALMRSETAQYPFTKSHVRSFLYHGFWFFGGKMHQFSLKALLENWMCLRALDLSFLGVKSLPDSIGELLHLRYLDLSHNDDLEVLPKSVTKLRNLQTLKLCWCQGLKELPKDLRKLVNLRVLDTTSTGITCMPSGIGELSCLRRLTVFAVEDASLSWKQRIDQLEELGQLKNLKGKLHLSFGFPEYTTKVKEESRKKGAYLRTKKHLNDIDIALKGRVDGEEATRLMEELQPHSNVKGLLFFGNGVRMPSWGRENNLVIFLPALIRLELSQVDIEHVMCLGNLAHLKTLSLDRLQTLRCIIEDRVTSVARSEATSSTSLIARGLSFFPSLEELNLSELPELESWTWKSGVEDNDQLCDTSSSDMTPLLLPQLKKMSIHICRNLKTTLLCPILEEIYLENFNQQLQIKIISSEESEDETSSSTDTAAFSPSTSACNIPKLWRVEIDNSAWLKSLAPEACQSLEYLSIRGDKEVVSIGDIGEVLRSCSSTLRFLQIEKCCNLRSFVCEGFEHLTALKELYILECQNLQLSKEGRESGTGMAIAPYSLQTLVLGNLQLLTDLPNWIQYLATLESLCIRACKGLESLPDWIPKLTSLRKLDLWGCSLRLKQRCQVPGEDWPHIQHIPSIIFDS